MTEHHPAHSDDIHPPHEHNRVSESYSWIHIVAKWMPENDLAYLAVAIGVVEGLSSTVYLVWTRQITLIM